MACIAGHRTTREAVRRTQESVADSVPEGAFFVSFVPAYAFVVSVWLFSS